MGNANNNPIGADLDWLAFQYVTGDMSDAERESFEIRLGDDQAAREAVASAVHLSAACREAFAAGNVKCAPAKPRRSAHRRTAQRLVVLAAGVAACLAIAWLGRFPGGGSDPGLADRGVTDRGASTVGSESLWGPDGARRVQQLALVWADLGEQLSPDEPPIRDAANEPPELNSEMISSAPSAPTPHDDDDELAAPDWLMAALDDDTNTDGNLDEG